MKSPSGRTHYEIIGNETEMKKMMKIRNFLDKVIYKDIIRYGKIKRKGNKISKVMKKKHKERENIEQ